VTSHHREPSRKFTVAVTLVVLAAPVTAYAESFPHYSLRQLAISAHQIVLAMPDPKGVKPLPERFVVQSTLKGTLKPGDTIELNYEKLYAIGPAFRGKKRPYRVKQALLFLTKPSADRAKQETYHLVGSGLCAQSEKGHVLVAQQWMNPGPYFLSRPSDLRRVKGKEPNWKDIVAKVRSDLVLIESIRELKRIPPGKNRNAAIFAWIEKNKAKFSRYSGLAYFGRFGGSKEGFGSLQGDVFQWILESRDPEDCWKAMELSVELGFTLPRGRAFRNNDARRLLIKKLKSRKPGLLLAVRATEILADHAGGEDVCRFLLDQAFDRRNDVALRVASVQAASDRDAIWGRTVYKEGKSRKLILKRAPQLTRAKRAELRAAAVKALYTASDSWDGNRRHLNSKAALPLLTEMYEDETHPLVRKELIYAVRRLGGVEFWKQISGNSFGIYARSSARQFKRDSVTFDLYLLLHNTRASGVGTPTVVFQTNDRSGIGPEISVAPTVKYSNRMRTNMVFEVARDRLKPGRYRVRVNGQATSGEKKGSWTSEPITIVLTKEGGRSDQ